MTRILLRPEDGVPCIVTLDGRKIAARLEGLDAIDAIRADPHARYDLRERSGMTPMAEWTLGPQSVHCYAASSTAPSDFLMLHHRDAEGRLERFSIINIDDLETDLASVGRHAEAITTTLRTAISSTEESGEAERIATILTGAAAVLVELGLGERITVHAPSPWGRAAVFSHGSRLSPDDPRVRDALQKLPVVTRVSGRDGQTRIGAASVSIGEPGHPDPDPMERIRAIAAFREATGHG